MGKYDNIPPPPRGKYDDIPPPPKSGSASDPGISGAMDQFKDMAGSAVSTVAAPFAWVGEKWDRAAGAPTRSGIMETIKTGSPYKGLMAAGDQLSKFDSNSAPSGKDIAQKLGLGETSLSDVFPDAYDEEGTGFRLKKGGLLDPTASGAAGTAIEMGADIGNVLPLVEGAKLAGKAGLATGKGLIKGTEYLGAGLRNVADVASGEIKAGTKIQQAGQAVATPVKKIAGMFSNEVSPKFAKAVEIAQKNGIDPELLSDDIKYGQKKFISRARRFLNEGPMGEDLLEQHQRGAQQIAKAIEKKTSAASPIEFYDDAEAGNHLVESLKNARDTLIGDDDLTYRKVTKFAPGLYVNKESAAPLESFLSGMESRAKGLQRRGILDQQGVGKDMQKIVDSVRSNFQGDKVSYKRLLDQMQYVGQAAFKDAPVLGKMPVAKKELQDLYFKMRDSLLDTVKRDVNPDFAKEIIQNNEKMSEFFKNQKTLQSAFDEANAPEKILNQVVYGTDSVKNRALTQMLANNPDTLNAMKSQYLKKIIGTADENGVLSFKKIRSNIEREKTRLGLFLNREEIKDLTDLADLGVSHGYDVLSHSGTGASAAVRDIGSPTGLLRQGAIRKGYDMAKRGGIPSTSAIIPGGVKTAEQAAAAGLIGAPAPSLLEQAKGLLSSPLKSRTSTDKGLKRMQMIHSIDKRSEEKNR